jgi:hypothetical protein
LPQEVVSDRAVKNDREDEREREMEHVFNRKLGEFPE